MKKESKKVIDLYSAPRVYRPESVQQRMERERKSIEKANNELLQRLIEARRKLSNKKDRD
ncbi:hypothetical protein EMIT07CA2_550125 [Brevibacillus sp. IT-7CA2]|uniref:hypothetical protein n=1 Tax=Brevibacillus sp. IT-7CA2 TaxID=3026436 RepID=UPI0039E0085C